MGGGLLRSPRLPLPTMQMPSFLNRTYISFALLVLLLAGMVWYFIEIVTYLIIALVLSGILRTPTDYLSQLSLFGLRIPRFVAIALSFGALMALVALFGLLFAPLVSKQIDALASLNYRQLVETLTAPVAYLEEVLQRQQFFQLEKGFLLDDLQTYLRQPILDFKLSNFINNLLSFTGSFFVGLLATLFITFFILNEKGAIRRSLLSLIPNRYFEVSITAFTKIEKLLSNYLLGILLQMISIFSIASFGLILAGVDYAVTIAVFAAVLNLIPFLGPVIGAVVGLIVGLSTTTGLADSEAYFWLMGKIAIVFAVLQLTDNILLQPIIFSKSVKAHPLEIFLIVFVGSTIQGPVGMILAIPVYTILKVSVSEFLKGYRRYRIFRNP
jgi:predicted PurR-regulated permease PerM